MKISTLIIASIGLLMSFTVAPVNPSSSNSLDETTSVTHRIQLCKYDKVVPVKVVELLRKVGNVKAVKSNGGSVYLSAPYPSEEEALKDLPKFQSMGFEKAEPVVEVNNEIMALNDYQTKLSKSEDEPTPIVRIWK